VCIWAVCSYGCSVRVSVDAEVFCAETVMNPMQLYPKDNVNVLPPADEIKFLLTLRSGLFSRQSVIAEAGQIYTAPTIARESRAIHDDKHMELLAALRSVLFCFLRDYGILAKRNSTAVSPIEIRSLIGSHTSQTQPSTCLSDGRKC